MEVPVLKNITKQFTYTGDNVSKVLNTYGPVTSNNPIVYGPY
jgi:hypothetical protein